MYRSHYLNQLRKTHIGEEVTLSGWVHRRRDHGGVIFIDLRDREGITQIVSNPEHNSKTHQIADSVRPEYIIKVQGKVRARPNDMINPKLDTGEIEILANTMEILNSAKTPPFEIDQEKDINEELRLKFRYIDLRRERLKKNIIIRHQIIKFLRDFFDSKGFLEIETPILMKGTPEGSREYLVPSRLHPGNFYVLPQSPQQLKQLLMVAGFDKYFQIARCFRDEDQRGDRQPEFTQLDLEMSFAEEKEIMDVNEEALILVSEKFQAHKKIHKKPFPRLKWEEAMNLYGSDKPDIRFDLELIDITNICKSCGFQVFEKTIENGGIVKALKIPNSQTLTRADIDGLEELVKKHGAKGLANIIFENNAIKSPLAKYFKPECLENLKEKLRVKNGDIVFIIADSFETTCAALGQLRLHFGQRLNLIDESILAYLWVTDFPLFEFSKEENKLVSCHHPFTHPKPEHIHLLDTHPEQVKAICYDFILNGVEIGGGSVRIHRADLQSKIFDLLNISKEDAERRFGHLIKAFQYGAPPHGGLAWGLDRLIMLFQNELNIREVMAFPKDQKARDLMTGSPSSMPQEQVAEAHIAIISKREEGIFGKLKKLLEDNHLWFEVKDHKAVKTSEKAAFVRGDLLEQGAKSLLLKDENNRYHIAVLSGATEIDFEKLKKIIKTNKLDIASSDELEAITECEKGALPPFGNLFDLPIFVDNKLLENENIAFNAGLTTKSIKMKTSDYVKVSKAIRDNFSRKKL